MATIVESTPSGIIYRHPTTYDIPNLDLLTLLFDSPHSAALDSTVLHLSAADPSLSLTKAQIRDLTQRTAHALRHRFGLGAQGPNKDCVTLISTGDYRLPVLFYSVIAAGGVVSSVSAASTSAELGRAIGQCESRLVVCNGDTRSVALQAAGECGLGAGRVLMIGEGREYAVLSAQDGQDVVSEDKLDWERITDPKVLEDSLICLLYSSGTTGLPKGVRLSHTNLVSQTVITNNLFNAHVAGRTPPFQYRTLAHLPTAHIAGMQGYFVNPFYIGGSVYWTPRFDFSQFLEYNARYRLTFFFTVPPIYLLIAKSPAVRGQFDTLEMAVSGAAPLGRELQIAASERLGRGTGSGCFIGQTWGLSETTGSATLTPLGAREDSGSVGELLPNVLARLVDDDGHDVAQGQPGELLIRGPIVSKGYHNNDDANKTAFVDGWFCTGDIGIFRGGLFYIVDRKKELIKYKGLQVAPAELEALLLSHPLILDAAVIGVQDDEGEQGAGTEVPRAYVVADRTAISGEEIEAFVKGKLASHKWLRGGVVFVDAIPKSPSGKILRKELRERVRRERGARL